MSHRKKIILVDDNPTNLTACEFALKDIYDIFPVSSAQFMFDKLSEMIPDLILLDVEMPVMCGYEAAKILKSNRQYKDIPLIFLTAKDDIESELEGLTLGAYDYIRKPIIKTLIRRRIETVLSLIEVQQEFQAAKEEAVRASMAKGEFLSRMSHEMRTPLNAVIGMIEIASRTDDMDKIDLCLKKAGAASKHLLNVINDILDISKIEEGKLELAEVEFAFEKMVNNVITVVKVKADEKAIQLDLNISEDVPTHINADELRLSQVITNLLTNAIKFTPQNGNVSLNVIRLEEDESHAVLLVEVADTGIGIEKEQQAKLFKPFEQANNKISQKFGGTGLGLAISKQIIEMMGGKIWIESELGKGSKFIFSFPAEKCDGLSLHDEGHQLTASDYDFSTKTVLAAEDVDINREIIMAILEDTKVTLDFVTNGQEAVDKFRENQNRYDLILMDVQMPVMDGHAATRAIREMNTQSANDITIIAMTANVFKEDIEACLMAGMNGHIGKPISFSALYETLNKYFSAQ